MFLLDLSGSSSPGISKSKTNSKRQEELLNYKTQERTSFFNRSFEQMEVSHKARPAMHNMIPGLAPEPFGEIPFF